MRTAVACLLALFVAAPSAAQQAPASCSTTGKNLFVRDVLSDLYLWYDLLPEADPARYPSPEAYLDAVRYRPLDASFSYITDRAASEALFSASQYVGLGFSSAFGTDGALRLTQVYPESPAAEAGLARGDRVDEINGRTIAEWIRANALGSAFGPAEEGVVATLVVSGRDGVRAVTLTKRPVTIPTVSSTRVFEFAGRRVGYVFFRNFVEPSFEALAAAAAELQTAGATELILDLRYNGGGLVQVARYLASLLGGTRTAGQVFAEYAHNDRHVADNEILRFELPNEALQLARVIAITTRASASASELVINSLRPFLPVVIVGDATYGKPVGQYAIPFCDKVVAPVAFQLRNANGEGDYFDGLPANCPAPDDLDAALGDPAEGSLREALVVVATGACSVPPPVPPEGAAPLRRRAAPPARSGWDAVVGAF